MVIARGAEALFMAIRPTNALASGAGVLVRLLCHHCRLL